MHTLTKVVRFGWVVLALVCLYAVAESPGDTKALAVPLEQESLFERVGTSAVLLDDYVVDLGTQITVPISASIPLPNALTAFTLRVEYDPGIIDFIDCESNTTNFNVALCNQDDGDGNPPDSVAFTAISVLGVSGDLLLGEITFVAVGTGSTQLHLVMGAWDDGSSEPPFLIDGSITVPGSNAVPSTLAVGSGTVAIGGLITIPITVSVPITNALMALTIRVEYDPIVVDFVSCTPNIGDFTAIVCANDDGDGEPPDSVAFSAIAVSGVKGELLIGEITFLALSAGETALHLDAPVFDDGSGLAPILVDGSLAVVGGDLLPSTLLVGSGTVGVGQSMTVPLTVSVPITNALTAFTVRVTYDPAIAAATACQINAAPFSVAYCNVPASELDSSAVVFSGIATTGVNGLLALGNITFMGTSAGNAPLTLVVEIFEDGSGLTPITMNGTLAVIGASPIPSVILAGSGTVAVGNEVTIPITISVPLTNVLAALTIHVAYDPALVDFAACSANTNTFDAAICNNDDDDGIFPDTVAFTALSVSGVNGELALGSIRFLGLLPGASALTIVVDVFEDGSGLSPVTIDGLVTVDSPVHRLYLPWLRYMPTHSSGLLLPGVGRTAVPFWPNCCTLTCSEAFL